MPIDPSMLAKSIGTLSDLHPDQDLAATLHQAVVAAKSLFDADAAGIMLVDLDGRLRWASASDQRAQTLEDNQEVFAAGPCMAAYTSGRPAMMHDATMERRWGEITLAMVELKGALADQLQVALESRGLIERAKGALMERERLDDQEAFTHLRRAARSSGRKLSEVAGEVAAGQPLPRGRTRPTPMPTEQPSSTAEPPQPDA